MASATHSRASKLAAATAVLSIALMSLPVLATEVTPVSPVGTTQPEAIDSFNATNLVMSFQRPGQGLSYENTTLENNSFDFSAYVSDTCFRATQYDRPSCFNRFGPYSDLRETLLSGKLFAILVQFHVMRPSDEKLVKTIIDEVASYGQPTIAIASEEAQLQAKVDDRTALVWRACKNNYSDRTDLASCFQRNHNLIRRTDVAVAGNIY